MGIPEEQLVRDQAPIKGIGGVPVLVEGKVKLALTLGEAPRTRTHHEGGSSSGIAGREREGEPHPEFNWKLYVDGASSTEGSGAGIMLKGPEDFKVCYALRLEFKASNNVAEYEALINGMLVALEVGVTDLEVNSDSQLVINQVTGMYQARDPLMQSYLAKVKTLEAKLTSRGVTIRFQRIPREENKEADLLSRLSKEELEQLPDEVYIQQG
ncbi:uncharacterized protein LOC122722135 [Manihot esculenta]|uniref:uncharacterized protein LOC122722135 n=1 Tax=Manihot esculenta TaxID=3983 RepID=UPI001CC363E4|nr:uncharacterized protein LOC122722135 [Manihot esculenta]